MKRRHDTYRLTKRFQEFTKKRLSNSKEILVISREPNRSLTSRFQTSQLIQTSQKLVNIRNSAIHLRQWKFLQHPFPRPSRPHKLHKSKSVNLLQTVCDSLCSLGAGDVAALCAEVGDAGENGVGKGEKVSETVIGGE